MGINNRNLDEILKTKKPFVDESTCGIYFLIKNNKVVYVGKSENIGLRVRVHKYSKDFDSFTIINCDSSELKNLERDYIFKFLPKYNKTVNVSSSDYILVSTLDEDVENQQIKGECFILNNKLYLKPEYSERIK